MVAAVVSHEQQKLGSRERPQVVDYLLVAAREKLEIGLRLWLGALEVGMIALQEGRVVHAEMPGATGDLALELLARIPEPRVTVEPRSGGPRSVQRDWRHVFAEPLRAAPSGRAARRGRVYDELRRLALLEDEESSDPGASMSMTSSAVVSIGNELRVATIELLGRVAVEAYLAGDLDAAQSLLQRCVRLCPDSEICRANLERVRLRILDEESLRGGLGGEE